jgi:hypothetical protein
MPTVWKLIMPSVVAPSTVRGLVPDGAERRGRYPHRVPGREVRRAPGLERNGRQQQQRPAPDLDGDRRGDGADGRAEVSDEQRGSATVCKILDAAGIDAAPEKVRADVAESLATQPHAILAVVFAHVDTAFPGADRLPGPDRPRPDRCQARNPVCRVLGRMT